MDIYTFQIAETIVLVLVFLILRFFAKRLIKKAGLRFNYQSGRIKITNKITLFMTVFLGIVINFNLNRCMFVKKQVKLFK